MIKGGHVLTKKFDQIILELEGRGLNPRLGASLRAGYVGDAVIGNVVILDSGKDDLSKVRKLEVIGYKVVVVLDGRLSDEEIKGFCDQVEGMVR